MYTQIRKIKPTRRSVSGVFAFRNTDSIPFESTLERDFLVKTEFDHHVTKIIPQPIQISFVGLNGHSYKYTPDFLVYFGERKACGDKYQKTMLVEVKPRSEIQENWSKLKPKFKSALRYAKERGWIYRIYDESRIRDQELDNIKFLHRYKRMELEPITTKEIKSILNVLGPQSIHDLLVHLSNKAPMQASYEAHIWHLLSIKSLKCDMRLSLSSNTIVWDSKQEI